MEVMKIPALAIRSLQMFRFAGAFIILLLGHCTYLSAVTLKRNRQILPVICFIMNLMLFWLIFFTLFRDYIDYPCKVYLGLFLASYSVSVFFSGIILIIKAYYASGKSRILLYCLIIAHLVAMGSNFYASVEMTTVYNPFSTLCTNTIEVKSFILSVATEILFNIIVTVTFLAYIFRASRQFNSSMYGILFRDGMVAWIGTAFSRGILAFSLFDVINDLSVIFIFISVILSCLILTWQLRRTISSKV
ncbi:hypothetical protein H4R33_004124 [Dimargaris cristalligena]|nr:hypothetical protein H4R33_004124 [Dimargaris cristalligena]